MALYYYIFMMNERVYYIFTNSTFKYIFLLLTSLQRFKSNDIYENVFCCYKFIFILCYTFEVLICSIGLNWFLLLRGRHFILFTGHGLCCLFVILYAMQEIEMSFIGLCIMHIALCKHGARVGDSKTVREWVFCHDDMICDLTVIYRVFLVYINYCTTDPILFLLYCITLKINILIFANKIHYEVCSILANVTFNLF